jgi:3-dehydroquinate synthase
MPDIQIDFGAQRTEIAVRRGVLSDLGPILRDQVQVPPDTRVVVVTDKTVAGIHGAKVLDSLGAAELDTLEYRIRPGEGSKSLAVAEEVYRFLADHAVGRDAIVVALGGGVVSDLAGFVAATWMRGVRFVVCPTTLEADVDASVGGKTAVNIPGGKNLVGAFHQPVLVAVDPTCLTTLPERDVRAGLAESIKHALISSGEFLQWHEENLREILALADAETSELILRNLRVKAGIVQLDAQEQTGLRMHLNFGHTIGHAIEECCGFALRHGECVSLGMLAACRMSQEAASLDGGTVARVEALLGGIGLPVRLADAIDTDRIMAAIRNDKKVRGKAVNFVLLDDIGHPKVLHDPPEDQVRKAYESLLP